MPRQRCLADDANDHAAITPHACTLDGNFAGAVFGDGQALGRSKFWVAAFEVIAICFPKRFPSFSPEGGISLPVASATGVLQHSIFSPEGGTVPENMPPSGLAIFMSTDPVADATGKNVSASGLFGQNQNVPIKSRITPND